MVSVDVVSKNAAAYPIGTRLGWDGTGERTGKEKEEVRGWRGMIWLIVRWST